MKKDLKELINSIQNDNLELFVDALDCDFTNQEIDLALKQIEDGYASNNGSEMKECLEDYKRFGKKVAVEKANYFNENEEDEEDED